MSMPPEGVERLSEPLRQPIRQYAARLQKLAGPRVLALTVYGAASAGTFDGRRHMIRSAVVFDMISLDLLRQLAEEGKELGKLRVAAPLVFTPDDLRDSCDTFPLEFIEIQQQNATIFGQDYFGPLTLAAADVRLQCERELKVVLIGLHQGLLASGGREQNLKRLGDDLTEHLMRTLRGVLWLSGPREGRGAREVVQEIEKLLKRSLPGLRHALAETDGTPWQQFCDLYADVQVVGRFVDAL